MSVVPAFDGSGRSSWPDDFARNQRSSLVHCGANAALAVWRAQDLQAQRPAIQPSGFPALDAVLPGNGWALGQLTEVWCSESGGGDWSLVLPALQGMAQRRQGVIVLVAPPLEPFVPSLFWHPSLAASLCMLRPSTGAAALWACEQALRCEQVVAVLLWQPWVAASALRRLQLAARKHQGGLWVFCSQQEERAARAMAGASPAALRLRVKPVQEGRQLEVQVFKCRGAMGGPPVVLPLRGAPTQQRWPRALPGQSDGLRAMQTACAGWPVPGWDGQVSAQEQQHVLDRVTLANA